MNMHPVKGEEIIRPVQRLAPELPIIRHHHEWYNGSGYPDHLVGEGIPKLARILHVADAFEALFVARMQALRVGDPMDEQTDVGPLANEQGLLDVEDALMRFPPDISSRPVSPRVLAALGDSNTRAAFVCRATDGAVRAFVRECLDPTALLAVQQEVMAGTRPPEY